MTYVPAELRTLVIFRAQESCEYCLVHADYAVLVHEIDHVIAEKHGGATEADNLAYACAQCNQHSYCLHCWLVLILIPCVLTTLP